MLPIFVGIYLTVSVAIGVIASRRVKDTADFALAGRSLPLAVVVATTFATWFGAETVLGVPAKFVDGGIGRTLEDPWGTSMALVLVGALLARPLYRMSLLTIGDFYRIRYGKAVEVLASLAIVVSYIGWVAAQVTALGRVFSLLMGDQLSDTQGMILGTLVVLAYTVLGGMWSVAMTDFVQMLLIIFGLAAIAWTAAGLAGGAGVVVQYAVDHDLLSFRMPDGPHETLFLVSATLTLMLGSIPQQDVFQRVMCAKNERIASIGPIIGGLSYLAFSAVPMFIVAASFVVAPDQSLALQGAEETELVLPTFVRTHMSEPLKVLFFGALLSAIMSTASATLLAPSTILVQNLFKDVWPSMSDRAELRMMRGTLLAVSIAVLVYALRMQGTTIYELVASSYEATIAAAFVPLVAGVYWKRATPSGGLASSVLGLAAWLTFLLSPLGKSFPAALAGLAAAVVGMVAGSLLSPPPEPPSITGSGATSISGPGTEAAGI